MNLGQFLMLTNVSQSAAAGLSFDSIQSTNSYSSETLTASIPGTMVPGDTLMVLVNGSNGASVSVSIPVAWDVDIYGTSPLLGGSNRAWAYLHYITAADISSGSLVISYTGGGSNTMHAIFIKGHALLDQYSFNGVDNNPAPASIVAPTLTTTGDGDLIFFHGSGYRFGVTTAPTFSTPSGYTVALGPATPTYVFALSAYMTQTSHGVVPDATSVTNFTGTADTDGSLIALKA